MDFFTVITLNFRILYGLFLIRHSHREVLHFNSTEHPTSEWVVQQLREAFPDDSNRYVIFDRDRKFGAAVLEFLDSCGIAAVRTSYQSPWQNGVAERWVLYVAKTSWAPFKQPLPNRRPPSRGAACNCSPAFVSCFGRLAGVSLSRPS
jgi:hypothetical protein